MVELEPGSVFEQQYRVIERLGKGGMAYVYLVESLELQSIKFAVKLIKLPESNPLLREDFLLRFRREAELLYKLGRRNNPHIIHLHGYRETSELGIPYLLLEYLDGVDLGKLLSEHGPMSLDMTMVVVRQVASALETLHSESVVHRDLSPQNIFICQELSEDHERSIHVKLLDFGVAKSQAPGDPLLTNVSMFIGKPAYASPEQFLMVPDLDHRSDQFCLAAIIYEMLCGERAFMRPTDDIKNSRLVQIIRDRVLTADPLDTEAARKLPGPVRHVLARALSKHRDHRFGTTREFIRALSAAAQPAKRGELASTDAGSIAAPAATSQITVWITIAAVGLLCLMLAVSIWSPGHVWPVPMTPPAPDLGVELVDLMAAQDASVIDLDGAVVDLQHLGDLNWHPNDLALKPLKPELHRQQILSRTLRFDPSTLSKEARTALEGCLSPATMGNWLAVNQHLRITLTRMEHGKYLANGFARRPADAQYYNDKFVKCLLRSLRTELPAAVTISR